MAAQQLNRHLALEMTMQDVLGNLEELALDFGYSDGEDCFEILAVEPCSVPDEFAKGHDATTVRPPLIEKPTQIFHRVA
jgi:hypothetical protein